ncbi:MAG: heavy metal translocating P-type ATPase [Lachnospiraceae bacterium]|nr:heavy metal translocating P-type ATPase [Lachnospiraceae bacterium]
MTRKQKKVLYRIILAAVLIVLISLLPLKGWIRAVLFLIPYLVIGYDILKKAILGIIHGEVFDENFLMAVATVGAMCLGEYLEGVAVMLFYQIGELFQSYAVGKSRKNITALMDIRPDYANMEVNGKLEKVDPDEVTPGSIIIVQPGEKVPLDGIVVEGSSTLNTSALTGESVPRDINSGDEIISGCVNLSGMIKVKTTKAFEESTVSKILDLVENSSMKKSRSENFITRFARYYTPFVCYAALALALLPPIINLLMGNASNFGEWISRALTFLVISCPCALVISIPLSFFGGIGGASARGILIKGSNYLEILSQSGYVVFDKTGTLTKGVFKVTEIHPEHTDKDTLLRYAAYAESYSTHPISKSLKEAYGQSIDTTLVADVKEFSGHGVSALVEGHTILAGNEKLMKENNITPSTPDGVGTVIHIAVDQSYVGYLLISDVIKEHAADAIRDLKAAGVRKTIMLTGDSKKVADSVAKTLGLDEVHSELLPADKVNQIEKILAEKPEKEKLAFVGDGINDAPVLSRADIGIAMGAMGSDAAIEAADIVLMDDDPSKIALAMKISRKTLRIVYENIIFALAVKFLCLLLGALGIANMWVAIFADVGVMVIAVINATRALATKNL